MRAYIIVPKDLIKVSAFEWLPQTVILCLYSLQPELEMFVVLVS